MGVGPKPSRRTVLAAVTASLAVTPGCIGAGSVAPEDGDDYDVGMSSIAFVPADLTVSVGETVVWKNTNTRTHTVTAYEHAMPATADYYASGGYASQEAAVDAYLNQLAGGIRSGATYRHTFSVPGEYRYFCIPHEQAGMTGRITVTE